MKVTVRDGTTAGETLATLDLQLEAEHVTVAELIRARVHQEVRAHNAAPDQRFSRLVEPEPAERALNGPRKRRRVDAERQTDIALRAFARGHVLLLIDDRQVDELSHTVTLQPDTTVTFLKLVPLVGG